MDRRTFIATGTWYSTGAWASVWLAPGYGEAAGIAPARITLAFGRPIVALFDATLAQADVFTGYAARRHIPTFDIGDDIGALWHIALAPRVARTPSALIGFTRASDYFVLTRLALRPGRLVAPATEASRPHANAAVSFVICA
ncbi:hypothetical protein [Paraburkholderia humisilvae]|uniref:Uncharacterized protein n=1 Tax=Paraburkholderia humisilvae TaxID=627669 RepID=A0A6J5DXY2_9BURK|nr:hypothetical protein [Paraburkholderia humisilvae]CAB3758948.1 hypothetical protein LMG29542_03477 [Paraburkholderia humisilvae]